MGAFALGLTVQSANAAVTVLEGLDPAAPEAAKPAPPPADEPSARPIPTPQPPRLLPDASPSSPIVVPRPAPTLPEPPTAVLPQAPVLDFGALSSSRPANPAQLAIEILPGPRVSVGSLVSFRITSKKAGYVVLLDVDSTGHLTQIYPNTASLLRTSRANANLVKPNSTMAIPLPTDPYAGVRYVVSPPLGQAMVVAVLSTSPVQILDLPDIPAELLGKPDLVLAYLSGQTNELRIPATNDQLQTTTWSFDAKPYTID